MLMVKAVEGIAERIGILTEVVRHALVKRTLHHIRKFSQLEQQRPLDLIGGGNQRTRGKPLYDRLAQDRLGAGGGVE